MRLRLTRRRVVIGAAAAVLVVAGAIVWSLARNYDSSDLTPAAFREAATSGLSDVRLPDPRNGGDVSRALRIHLAASLGDDARFRCRQMKVPPQPNRYFCRLREAGAHRVLWATYRVDPRSGGVSVFRIGALPIVNYH
jgi:hypothetical protein